MLTFSMLSLKHSPLWKHGIYLPSASLREQFPANAGSVIWRSQSSAPTRLRLLSLSTSISCQHPCSMSSTRFWATGKQEPCLNYCEVSQGPQRISKHTLGAQSVVNVCFPCAYYEKCYFVLFIACRSRSSKPSLMLINRNPPLFCPICNKGTWSSLVFLVFKLMWNLHVVKCTYLTCTAWWISPSLYFLGTTAWIKRWNLQLPPKVPLFAFPAS